MSSRLTRACFPLAALVVLALALTASIAGAAGGTRPPTQLLPDLDQEFPSQLRVILAGTQSAPSYQLGFMSAVRNIGDGPLVISGHRDPSSPTMTADQLIDRTDGSRTVVPAIGSLRFVHSPSHNHWHYLGFDRYELRRAGSPKVLEHDGKTGFCLGDRYRASGRYPNAVRQPVYVSRCGLNDTGLTSIEEGISVGWGDDYPAFIEFQDLPLDGLPAGRYVLVHEVNADRKLRESSYANDAASILLDLRWRGSVPYLRVLDSCPDSGRCDGGATAAAKPVAHISGSFTPNDTADTTGRGWAALQWNFAGPNGVDAPRAWANLIADGAPGGAGVTIAVLDTGVAYADRPPYRLSPDLDARTFVPGWDFVDNDPYPLDENGHGTQVASIIAEETDNAYGLTGLAYGARIMPVRVLDRFGQGDAATIARGVVYAVDHGAKVISLSLNFAPSVVEAQIPALLHAFAYATAKGTLVVAAAGNEAAARVDLPARAPGVLAVGATTEFGCLSQYSNFGSALDVVAPGGGADAALADDPYCEKGRAGRPIYQVGLDRLPDQFGIGNPYIGTSMAAPEVSAIAALVVASGVLGPNPSPAEIAAHIEQTSRDLGPAGRDAHYGWGLVDAGAATAKNVPKRLPPTR